MIGDYQWRPESPSQNYHLMGRTFHANTFKLSVVEPAVLTRTFATCTFSGSVAPSVNKT